MTHPRSTGAIRRLSDFLVYTQRYRVGLLVLGAAWFAATHMLGLTPESGLPGSWVTGAVLALTALTWLFMPQAARWWVSNTKRPVRVFYAFLLVLDTAVICITIPFTDGVNSITYILFYFLAVGNCYMFPPKGTNIANGFIALSYVVTLLLVPEQYHPPELLNWIDILLIRIPLIFLVSSYARWLVQRGDHLAEADQQRYANTMHGLLGALEARDGYTQQHSMNVGRWAVAFARYLGLSEDDCNVLLEAAELHDIGKIGIPDSILNKPGRLTPAEQEIMREHPLIGVRITQHLRWLNQHHRAIIEHHHERWDGQGYPARLKGRETPLLARLTALADVLDALINTRPYRPGMPGSVALQIIRQGRGTHFDPDLTDKFLRFMDDLQELIRRHVDAIDFGPAAWTEEIVRIRVTTADGHKVVLLRNAQRGWEWLGVEPALAEQAGEASD